MAQHNFLSRVRIQSDKKMSAPIQADTTSALNDYTFGELRSIESFVPATNKVR